MNMIKFENQFGQFLIRLVFVPLAGLIMVFLAVCVIGLIFNLLCNLPLAGIYWLTHLGVFQDYLISIPLGLFTGFKINRKTSALADFFPWVGPAILFTYIYFSPDPWDSTGNRGVFGKNCSECLNIIFITTPLLFSLAYSGMTLLLRLTDRVRRSSANA